MNFKKIKKTFIVAEIGVNHEGKIGLAKKMINLASKAGVDAVKFQTYKHDQYVSSSQPERLARVKKFELSHKQFENLFNYAKKKKLICFSTPLHVDDINFLKDKSQMIKISSGDLTHHNLLAYAALTNLPLIISTGMATIKEIDGALKVLKKINPKLINDGKVMLLHCVALYPTEREKINLKGITFLRKKYKLPIGFSDHTIGIKACLAATCLGAKLIEKHFTYRIEDQDFHDHKISADFKMMKRLVEEIKDLEKYLGDESKKISFDERNNRKHLRRSFAARTNLKKGKKLCDEDLILLRPEWGFKAHEKNKLINKKLKKDINQGEIILKKNVN